MWGWWWSKHAVLPQTEGTAGSGVVAVPVLVSAGKDGICTVCAPHSVQYVCTQCAVCVHTHRTLSTFVSHGGTSSPGLDDQRARGSGSSESSDAVRQGDVASAPVILHRPRPSALSPQREAKSPPLWLGDAPVDAVGPRPERKVGELRGKAFSSDITLRQLLLMRVAVRSCLEY